MLLFMVPADSDDIAKDYEILLGELTQYNPELPITSVSFPFLSFTIMLVIVAP